MSEPGETRNGNGTLRQVLTGSLIALFSGIMGFSLSQLLSVQALATKEDINTHDIASLREVDSSIKLQQVNDIIRTDKEISVLAQLFQSNMELNRELVGLVKVQNELLRQHK